MRSDKQVVARACFSSFFFGRPHFEQGLEGQGRGRGERPNRQEIYRHLRFLIFPRGLGGPCIALVKCGVGIWVYSLVGTLNEGLRAVRNISSLVACYSRSGVGIWVYSLVGTLRGSIKGP